MIRVRVIGRSCGLIFSPCEDSRFFALLSRIHSEAIFWPFLSSGSVHTCTVLYDADALRKQAHAMTRPPSSALSRRQRRSWLGTKSRTAVSPPAPSVQEGGKRSRLDLLRGGDGLDLVNCWSNVWGRW